MMKINEMVKRVKYLEEITKVMFSLDKEKKGKLSTEIYEEFKRAMENSKVNALKARNNAERKLLAL